MEAVLKHYHIGAVWHCTDRSNLESIKKQGGILSFAELQRRGITVATPGGNKWSHDADIINGVHEYVHLAFIQDHPMLYRAIDQSRIPNPVWLRIDTSVLLQAGVRYTNAVSNKAGVVLLTHDIARDVIDFEALFTFMDWRDPEIKKRCMAARKSEILVPNIVPYNMILEIKNG